MKNIMRAVIALGFVIIIGGAGNADVNSASVLTALSTSFIGVLTVLCGMTGLYFYNKKLRRRRIRKLTAKRKREIAEIRMNEEKRLAAKRRKQFSITEIA